MFTYWNGYEVDGSSTTYNIVVPERKLVEEVVRYFLNLKVINRKAAITLSYTLGDEKQPLHYRHPNSIEGENYTHEDIDRICAVLERPELNSFYLSTECLQPDFLYHEVKKDLFRLSKTRPGAEEVEYHYTDPTICPLYFGAGLGVTLEVSFAEGTNPMSNYEIDGLIFNREKLINNLKNTHFTVGFVCGPTFIYEYAAYIVSKIAERFPEIGIDGGIDCAGGFVDGCTYSSNLYDFEKITLTTDNIADAITYILKAMEIKPQKRGGKYGHERTNSEKLSLYNLYNLDKAEDVRIGTEKKIIKHILAGKTEFTPQEYEAFVRKISEIEIIDRADFMKYSTCCLKIDGEIGALTCVKGEGRVLLQLIVASVQREGVVKELKAAGFDIR